LDDVAVYAFVVVQVQWSERGAELHDGDVGSLGEAWDERDTHVEESAVWCQGGEHEAGEGDLFADGRRRVDVPSGAPYSNLRRMSCTSSVACAAVGRYTKSEGEESITLAELYG
jgi:hypothetical protein